MERKKQTKGSCVYCGRKMTKRGISKHLQSCNKRVEVITTANAKPGKEEIFYHLQIQDNWLGDYWLILEISGKATFIDLDYYLRTIWLECCDHLSEFSFSKRGEDIYMDSKVEQILSKGVELIHIYDFGTSSITKIKVVSTRKGKATTTHPIVLMARNDPPEAYCIECGKPASRFCLECIHEDYESEGTLCDEHAQSHQHDDYGEPMPLVNSPRLGMCGYTGPAKPPY